MTEKTLKQLLSKGESVSIEFKTSFGKDAIETLSAFANTKGGSVIVGATDHGEIQGLHLGKETLQQWLNQIKLNTSPSIIPDIETTTIGNKTLVVLTIIEYPVKPVSCRGKYFKRIRNSNHQMSINEISNLHLKTYHASWDHYMAWPSRFLKKFRMVLRWRFLKPPRKPGRATKFLKYCIQIQA